MDTEHFMNDCFIIAKLFLLICLTVVIIIYFLFIILTGRAIQPRLAFVW